MTKPIPPDDHDLGHIQAVLDRLNLGPAPKPITARVIVELTIDTDVMPAHLAANAEWLLASHADIVARLVRKHLRSHVMGREVSYTVCAKPGFGAEAGTR